MQRWFWNLKLKKKILLIILLTILSTVILENQNRQASYNTYNQLLYEKNSQILLLYMNYIENVFERIENVTYLMLADQKLQEDLMCFRDDEGGRDWIRSMTEISKAVNSYALREEYFSAFLLVTKGGIFGYSNNNLGLDSDFSPYINMVKNANGKVKFDSRTEQLTLVREIRQSANLDLSNLGYIVTLTNGTFGRPHLNTSIFYVMLLLEVNHALV